MTRADKIEKRKARAKKRRDKHMKKYLQKIVYASRIEGYRVPLSSVDVRYGYNGGSWKDESSPTGYSQVCSYKGICQSPCNGDC